MASGFGFDGGRSRCFPQWQEFSKCYANATRPKECALLSEDYLECLHHGKELSRAKTVKAHFIQKQVSEGKEGRKVAEVLSEGVIVGVGLISSDEKSQAR